MKTALVRLLSILLLGLGVYLVLPYHMPFFRFIVMALAFGLSYHLWATKL